MKVLITEKLEQLLQSQWTSFLDQNKLVKITLEHVRDTAYETLQQKQMPKRQTRISVTKFLVTESPLVLEMWVEFLVPKDAGVVVGTHVFYVSLTGEVKLKETHGTHIVQL